MYYEGFIAIRNGLINEFNEWKYNVEVWFKPFRNRSIHLYNDLILEIVTTSGFLGHAFKTNQV